MMRPSLVFVKYLHRRYVRELPKRYEDGQKRGTVREKILTIQLGGYA